MSGQHRADRFGSMNLDDERHLWHGAPLANAPEQLEPFPPRRAAPAPVPSLPRAGAAPAALELAHEADQLERGDQAAHLEPVWPSDLDRWEAGQLEQIAAEFNLLRRMFL